MFNLDVLQKKKEEISQKIHAAMKEGNEENFSQAFTELMQVMEDAVTAEARGLVQSVDNTVLAGRGVRVLTSQEKEFYQKFIDNAWSSNPKQALTGTDTVLPKTIIDAVMEDMVEAHPILDAIDFQNTEALTEIYISTTGGKAVWGEITAAITGELSAAFAKIELAKKKMTAFIFVSKGILELGPEWMDRYVRALLVEANAAGLEEAVVDGDGDDKMIGMTRALTGAVDGVYPRKDAVVITNLNPDTYGSILNTLRQGPNSKSRAIQSIIMVVNPADYFTKVMPATTVRKTDGTFETNVFPFPTTVHQSAACPEGYAVFGLPKRFWAGIGSAGKGGRLEYDDSYKFLEDLRTYIIKLFGDGRPLDANAFVLADISGLVPYVQRVYVENDPLLVQGLGDARLASLSIGSLDLSPAFNKSVFVYEVATTNATNTITAVPKDGEATVEILNGVTEVTNGAAATWAEGENTVTINVTSGTETETYTITVTKS